MSKKLSKYNYSALIFIALLILANLYVALPTHFAFSDNKKINKPLEIKDTKKNDFGSETVEPLDESNVKPLPLSLVEDPNEETENKTANKVASETKEVEEPEDKMEEDSDDSAEAKDGQTDKTLTTSLNGNEIDISALVKTFSKITKRNYIVDNNVKGKVAIHLASPVTIGEAIKIFESVLLLKGFTTVPMGYNTWKVISAKDAKQTTIPTIYNGEGSSEALVTNLMRLKNTQATDIQQAISQFVSKDGLINSFAATNSLIIIDTASNIKRLTSLVSQLDVPALDQDISIIPIQHADVKDVSDKIQEILGLDKEDKSGAQSAVRNPIPRAIPAINQNNNINAANVSGEKRQVPFKVIPDERTNSIICVADQITTDKVKALVEQLDSPVNKSSGKFYVYRLQHADAEEMAEVVGNLISGTSSGSGSSSGSSNSSANKNKSSSSSTIGNSSFSSKSRNSDSDSNSTSSSSNKGNSSRGSTVVTGEGGKFNLDGEVSVAADSSTNSLIINASKSDYEKIKELIDTLDVKRHQVLVEATILEVSLTKNEGAGLELQSTAGTNQGGVIGQTNFGKLTSLLTNPSALSDLTIAAASSGSIVLPGGLTLPSQALLISAVSNNSNVNVLSSPTILATDNQEAEIKVGQNVPFVTSTSTNQTNLNNTFNQIERQDVGIKLRITPQISAGDFVVLKIFVEISSVVTGTANNANGPTTTLRTTETMVEVKSNQMIVTGGLISDSVEEATRGVPFIKDIPVIGNLFEREDTDRKRTNLLVFITPKIIKDQFVARDETVDLTTKMKKTIAEQNSSPDRHEVLDSSSLNRVVETRENNDIEVSTITPPRAGAPTVADEEKQAATRTKERLKILEDTTPNKPTSNKDVANKEEELEFSVKPKLPTTK